MAEDLSNPMPPSLGGRLNVLYETRRVLLPPMGERALPQMVIASTLAIALLSILLSLTWVQKSDIDYLRGSAGVTTLESQAFLLTMPGKAPISVSLGVLGDTSVGELAGAPFQVAAEIDPAVVKEFMEKAGDQPVVLSLPGIEFEKMEVQSSWLAPRTFLRGERSILVFDQKITKDTPRFTLAMTVWPHNTQERIVRSTVNMEPTFLAVQTRYQKYQDFLAGRRTGSGKQLADIGRIVLAIFSVFLFIFIDSSPECLALAMFMSLKALAVAVGQGWLPDNVFSANSMTMARHFLLSFADFMQLYFFTQLARLWRPRPLVFLALGITFGTFYTMGAMVVPTPGGINWPHQVWKWRNVLIGIGCLACALPVAVVCFKARLYHRTAALLVASSGVLVQIITPFIVGIPGVTESLWYKTWYNLFETHTPYMFALSTFINVSTLERRVKTLSRAAIRKDAIERELTLGKAVQEAFFQIPELPKGIGMSYAHAAAEYVSGDILFSHWDRGAHTVTMVLCDVTGHGVQAALKASICSSMAASIWEHGQLRPGDDPARRLEILHRRVTAYLTKTSGNPEILAMVGCELDLNTGNARLYRANGLYPLVIAKEEGSWKATIHARAGEQLTSVPVPEGGFILLFSDGLIDGARTLKRLIDHVEASMATAGLLDANAVKETVFKFDGFVETNDDKTMAVLEVRKSALGQRAEAA